MIGILDSGVGGLSIYREIKKHFPDQATIYFADKNNFPYGEKSESELLEIVRAAIQAMTNLGASIIVLGCNSATVTTASKLRTEFDIPIVGIEPAVKLAAAQTKNGKIGVMATKITTKEHHGEDLAPNCTLFKYHNGDLVSKIENNFEEITDQDLKLAMAPFLDVGVDSVVLGCTHYHFIKDRLEKLYPEISFYAPDRAVVNHLMTVISEDNIELVCGSDVFLCSADSASFSESLNKLLGIKNADIREI